MIKSEDAFQAFFINDKQFGEPCFEGQLFAKITQIAGKNIQPEIDLLDVVGIEPEPNSNLRAFEFKILNSLTVSNNYKNVYAGVGQALSYFKYGIDQCLLIIGISETIPLPQTEILHELIAKVGETLSNLSENRFQIRMYREFNNEITDFPAFFPTGKYERRDTKRFHDDVQLSRDNLLALNFSAKKGKTFFKKYGVQSEHVF